MTRNLIAILLLAAASAAGATPPPRFSRELQTSPGWTRVEIPWDVYDAARPGLADLRILDARGREVPYAIDRGHEAVDRVEIRNLQSRARQETTGVIDRGTAPSLIDGLSVDIEGTTFLKPLTVEGSDDQGTWGVVARGSIFATAETRSTVLRFAPNAMRFLRLRFDDRNSDPVVIREILLIRHAQQTLTAVPVEVRDRVEATGVSRSTLILPASNLPLVALRIGAQEPAYSRHVRIEERVFDQGDVSRRLVGDGWIVRAPGRSDEAEIPLCQTTRRAFELEVMNGDSPPLRSLNVVALVQPQSLLFFAEEPSYRMEYGSAEARMPSYDLTAALGARAPAHTRTALLGAPIDRGASSAQLRVPDRGAAIQSSDWSTRQRIVLPAHGNVAFLDLDEIPTSQLDDLRIVDSASRQVPYLMEPDAKERRERLPFRQSVAGSKTILRATVSPGRNIRSLELEESAADYFSREVTVFEETVDPRGITAERVLGSAHWERRPGQPAEPLEVPLSQAAEKRLRIEVENGDNAPLQVSQLWIVVSIERVSFVFRPGETLQLLTGNPAARAPRYDFAMLADIVLPSVAAAASLQPVPAPRQTSLPRWFWAVAVVAGVLLAAALARTLMRPHDERPPVG